MLIRITYLKTALLLWSIGSHASPEFRTFRERQFLQADIWKPIDTASLDLLNGPQSDPYFRFNEWVTCDFQEIKRHTSGRTQKFYCVVRGGRYAGQKIKVKYADRVQNKEPYTETAASRLLWALGFRSESARPVRVKCFGCLPDPFGSKQMRPVPGSQIFEIAMIDVRPKATIIQEREDQGWDWSDLDEIAKYRNDAQTRAEIDALKLFAVFIHHFDNKSANNALLCDQKVEEKNLMSQCRSSSLIIHDLGWSFGRGFLPRDVVPGGAPAAANYLNWSQHAVWKDKAKCIGNIPHLRKMLRIISFQAHGVLRHPRISEGGRRLLASKLKQLSRKQIYDLFRAARFDQRKSQITDSSGNLRFTTINDWVALFEQKRDEITEHPGCPW